METNEELPMCCITLYPSDIYTQNKRALAIIADAPEFIPEAWKPLFTEEALKADYLLFQPGEGNPRASGFCTPDWQIGEWR